MRWMVITAVATIAAGAVAAVEKPTAQDCLKTLVSGHPRLLLTDARLAELKEMAKTDAVLQKCVREVLARADGYVGREPVKYRLIGPRLLSVSRECLHRVVTCSLAYRWTGEKKYADTAIANMLAACEFKDWNPSHYLDTAEMSNAVGLGYDWLYGYMDEPTRQRIRAGLIKRGLEEGMKAYGLRDGKKHGFVTNAFNWNQVCNGGMIVGALALAETHPEYAKAIIPAAVESLPLALKSYAPDGAWMEGPGYWNYATNYTAYGLDALRTALGTDFGLSQVEGLAQAGRAPIYTAGPTGMYLCYADCGEKSRRRAMPCMFWLARTFHDPVVAADEHAELAKGDAAAEHVIWYVPPVKDRLAVRDLDHYFRGDVEVAVFRSSWENPNALWVGVKGGYNQVNHGHLDLGNFELDALGVRWAVDLGSDDYNMPGYWSKQPGGQRWKYYRLNSESHNVPMLGGEGQDAMAKSRFTKIKSGDDPFVLVDLTEAYKGFAGRAMRGIGMVRGRMAVLVQDEFSIEKPCEMAWGMMTEAEITIKEDGSAELRQGGKKLVVRALAPAGAKFAVESAHRNPPEKANDGFRRLVLRIPDAKGDVRVAVLLAPVWKRGPFLNAKVDTLLGPGRFTGVLWEQISDVKVRALSAW